MLKRLYLITKEKIPLPHRLIDKHYVYEIEKNKVLVFTRHPLPNYKSYYISPVTIEGKDQSQYVTGIVYHTNLGITKLIPQPETQNYVLKYFDTIISVKNENLPIIELASLIL